MCGNSGEEQMRATFARLENPAPFVVATLSAAAKSWKLPLELLI
jgi:hypothetical protein